jgi:integrase
MTARAFGCTVRFERRQTRLVLAAHALPASSRLANPSIAEVATLISAAEDDRLGALYVTAVGTGLRQGELLGLQWSDIDLDGATLTVWRQLSEDGGVLELVEPKTDRGRRRVELPEFVVSALRAHRAADARRGTRFRRLGIPRYRRQPAPKEQPATPLVPAVLTARRAAEDSVP